MTLEGLRMAGLHSIIGRVWCNLLFLKHFPEALKHFESFLTRDWHGFFSQLQKSQNL
jgi:hypothetical protein